MIKKLVVENTTNTIRWPNYSKIFQVKELTISFFFFLSV